MNQVPVPVIIILGVIGYAAFWCALIWLIGQFSGWTQLGRRFRATERFDGKRWYFQHARMRWSCNYSGCLTVGVNAAGLYLAVWPMFRPGHPPLFIPWGETSIAMEQTFWLGRHMKIQFPGMPGLVICFHRRLADRIAGSFVTLPG